MWSLPAACTNNQVYKMMMAPIPGGGGMKVWQHIYHMYKLRTRNWQWETDIILKGHCKLLLTTYLIFSISKLQLDYYTYWSCQTGAPGADFVGSLWGVLPLSFHDFHDVARWQTCNAPSVSFFLPCWNLKLFWLPRTDTTLWIWQWARDVFSYRAKRTSGYCRSSLPLCTHDDFWAMLSSSHSITGSEVWLAYDIHDYTHFSIAYWYDLVLLGF